MNDARRTRRIDARRELRSRRSDEALVAQYIHDLSVRHARAMPKVLDSAGPAQRRGVEVPAASTA
jgi:hypothetical protein